MQTDTVTIHARSGKAARVRQGQSVTVTNTHGSQVVDTWAFNAEDLGEWMSMEHSRPYYMKLRPEVGDTLVTNRRRPILTLTEDTSGGAHDTLIAACDQPRYKLLGVTEYHDNCADNLSAGLAELGLTKPVTPSPLNLFMHIPWTVGGKLSWEEPLSQPGSYVTLRTEMDLVIAFSACPQDILPINGRVGQPTEAHFHIV
jgi:uncharacterized protein YcgI (DUF1989 family)